MIQREEVLQFGQIQKSHGLQGEVSISFSADIFDEEGGLAAPCLICEIDGILVPFFIEDYRFKNDETLLVKFEKIDTEEETHILYNAKVFIEKRYLADDIAGEDIEGASYYIGFQLFGEDEGLIGSIVDVDDETENVLFLVKNEEGKEYIIPATDDFISAIDDEKKTITMHLPIGLLDMSLAEDTGE